MKKIFSFIVIMMGLLALEGCVVPFSPPEVSSANRFLVVDGFLNTNGVDSSSVMLTYTQVVSNKNTFTTELRARVTVEGNKGSTYTLTEIGKGLYRLPDVYKRQLIYIEMERPRRTGQILPRKLICLSNPASPDWSRQVYQPAKL